MSRGNPPMARVDGQANEPPESKTATVTVLIAVFLDWVERHTKATTYDLYRYISGVS